MREEDDVGWEWDRGIWEEDDCWEEEGKIEHKHRGDISIQQ